MTRILALILALVLVALVLTSAASAQDATAEPTVEVTETPEQPPVVEVPNADTYISISTLIYGLLVAVLGGGTVGVILNRFGGNKANQDALEKLYKSFPPETQDMITRLLDIAEEAVKLGRTVTDGRPNDDTPALNLPRKPLN